MEIGNKIKEARNGAGLTQDQAAEKIMPEQKIDREFRRRKPL